MDVNQTIMLYTLNLYSDVYYFSMKLEKIFLRTEEKQYFNTLTQ